MPVEKFRSIEDMNAAPLRAPAEERLRRFTRLCARMRTLAQRRYRPGVFKFRSLEEAQAAREQASFRLPDSK